METTDTIYTAPDLRAEATAVAAAYLQILNPDEAMTSGELDAFSVGVQAGITAAIEITTRQEVGSRG